LKYWDFLDFFINFLQKIQKITIFQKHEDIWSYFWQFWTKNQKNQNISFSVINRDLFLINFSQKMSKKVLYVKVKTQKITNFKNHEDIWSFFGHFLTFFDIFFSFFWLKNHEDIWPKNPKNDQFQKSQRYMTLFLTIFDIFWFFFVIFLISYILVFFDKKSQKSLISKLRLTGGPFLSIFDDFLTKNTKNHTISKTRGYMILFLIKNH